jgi:hypothetical protein
VRGKRHLLWGSLEEVTSFTGQPTSKSKLCYERRVGQSVLVSGHHLGPVTNFSFSSIEIFFGHMPFSVMARPL